MNVQTVSRESLQARLAELSREEGAAVLDGKPFDSRKRSAVEIQLRALDAAEAEQARRNRIAADQDRTTLNRQLERELSEHLKQYLRDVREAQDGLRAYAAAMSRLLKTSQEIARLTYTISNVVPPAFNPNDLQSRFGCRTAAILRATIGYRLGTLEFMPGFFRCDDDWRDGEAALVKNSFDLSMEASENGKGD